MFEPSRIFGNTNAKTGLFEWFFTVNGADIGPFSSREEATKELKKHTNLSTNSGNLSSAKKNTHLSLIPIVNGDYNKANETREEQWNLERAQLQSTIDSLMAKEEQWEQEREQLQSTIDRLQIQLDCMNFDMLHRRL